MTNTTIDEYDSSIIEFFCKVYLIGDFYEQGELFHLWVSNIRKKSIQDNYGPRIKHQISEIKIQIDFIVCQYF